MAILSVKNLKKIYTTRFGGNQGYTGGNGRTDRQASGIGLYLCRRICQNLGHTIAAVAHEDGTELQIDLQSERLEIE